MTEAAVIVGEASGAAAALERILDQDGMTVRFRTPGALLDGGAEPGAPAPTLVLVDGALDRGTVRRVVESLADPQESPPMVVCFAEADKVSRLEPHLRNGLEYLIPPFAAMHVRNRLQSGRHHLAKVPSEMLDDYERELQIGREIQRGFLPAELPALPGWDVVAHFAPAREVGGDFYDAYPIGAGSLAFAVADVCDKGVGAALFMALVRSLLRANAGGAGDEPGPELALRSVNETNAYLVANHLQQAYFATLFFGVLDPVSGELSYLNCGHNPPVLRRAGGEQQRLNPTGPALGLTAEAEFRMERVPIEPGDLLFCYTDGVTEARDPAGRFLGEAALTDLLAAGGAARPVLQRFVDATTVHHGGQPPSDDITMFVLHRAADDPASAAGQ
jgi:sigma-B regulation protein RsbU (phosphoserine phosphatase)